MSSYPSEWDDDWTCDPYGENSLRDIDLSHVIAYLDVPSRRRQLRALPYHEYLRTTHWQATRRAALQRAGRRCERCGRWRDLQVHHLTYERLGVEDDGDLMVLCDRCHEHTHGIAS